MTYRCECGTCQYKHRAEEAEKRLADLLAEMEAWRDVELREAPGRRSEVVDVLRIVIRAIRVKAQG